MAALFWRFVADLTSFAWNELQQARGLFKELGMAELPLLRRGPSPTKLFEFKHSLNAVNRTK